MILVYLTYNILHGLLVFNDGYFITVMSSSQHYRP